MNRGKKIVLGIAGFFGVLLLLAVIAVLVISVYLLHAGPFGKHQPESPAVTADAITEEDFLHASGNVLRNENDEVVALEGVNLGGWLLQEYWMCPLLEYPATVSGSSLNALYVLQVLEDRFGIQKAQELMELYQKNWITEWDLQNIASMGCNVIRVPFWYRNFMRDSNGKWISKNPDENPGFQTLDWVIETAKKNGLYVVLDMHGCPGGQGKNQTTGSAEMDLYKDADCQQAAEDLWVAIAQRYKDEPAVMGYDLMNEPEKPDHDADVDSDLRNILYDRFYQAIRQVDEKHIIIMEGIWSLDALPEPEERTWENIVYETHFYGDKVREETENAWTYSEQHQIPIYIGEFCDPVVQEVCESHEMSYTFWSYKGIAWKIGKRSYLDSDWFMHAGTHCFPAMVRYDPYWLLKLKWGTSIQTRNFSVENAKIHFGDQ